MSSAHPTKRTNLSSVKDGGDARTDRRLAAIVSIDVVESSRLMEADETGTYHALLDFRQSVIEPLIATHHGRTVKLTGDGALIEFGSAVDAVNCSAEILQKAKDWNETVPAERQIIFRIGINVEDIIVGDDDIYGTGVNVAARLEALADAGTIFVSAAVVEHAKNRVNHGFEYIGKRQVKNIEEPIQVYELRPQGAASQPFHRRFLRLKPWPWIAGLALLLLFLGVFMSRPLWERAGSVVPVANKASIVVLPFNNLSGDPAEEYFADGLTEDLTTNLAKFNELFVIARNSAFTYKGKPTKAQALGTELGVNYVLEGSIQKSDGQLRISAQLIDAASGAHLWAERYDRSPERIFDIQDEVTTAISGALTGTSGLLGLAEWKRIANKQPQNFVAYDYLMKGWHEWYKFTREGNKAAREFFELSRKADPKYARAYSALAWTHALDYESEWTDDYEGAVNQALVLAKEAVDLDDKDFRNYWVLGWAYLYSWQHVEAEAAYNKALELNPNDAELLAEMTSLLIFVERPEQAITQLKEAMRRNPFFDRWYLEYLGWAYEEAGQPQACVDTLAKTIDSEPTMEQLYVLRILAACYADPKVNQPLQAAAIAKKILALDPQFSMAAHRKFVQETFPYKSQELVDRWMAAFSRVGGLPP
jgi:adenylate cyclase